jgi:hypothetical protein
MKQSFTVKLSPDFYILCDFFGFNPDEVVQYYLNHISLSLFVDVSLDNPFGAATYFFIQYSDTNEQE